LNSLPRRDAATATTVAVLLSLALLVNYIDRGSMSIAAPLLMREFSLTPSAMGWVLSAFFWTYVIFQPINGALADRFGPERVLASGLALWSIATVMTGLSSGLMSLIAFRLVMGASESVFYPSALSVLATRVADRFRSRATGTMQLGSYVGPFLGALVGGWVMYLYGWRVMFMGLGVLSLLWLIPWLRMVGLHRATPIATPGSDPPALATYPEILSQRGLWAAMLGTFCGNYMFFLIFTWLPLYLVQERGLSLVTSLRYTSLFYWAEAASVFISGWLIDRWILSGASANRAYKSALAFSCIGVGLCLLACSRVGMTGLPYILILMGVADGLAGPSNCSMTQIMAGPVATGRWMGLQNAMGNVAGITAPIITGYIVQATGHYSAAFVVASVIALVGVFAWLVLMPTVRAVQWGSAAAV
jgi:ACS family D-galactonate transporter-like MFS transporter